MHKILLSLSILTFAVGASVLGRQARAATVEDILEHAATHHEDLPNFVCTYSEHQYVRNGAYGDWKLKRWYEAEARVVDGITKCKVLTFKGKPSRKKLYQVARTFWLFGGHFSQFLDPRQNYRIGKGTRIAGTPLQVFDMVSDAGMGLYRGITKRGELKHQKRVPTRGKLWVESDTGRIVKSSESWTILGDGVHPPGEGNFIAEYGYFDIGGKSYSLPAKNTFTDLPYSDQYRDTLVVLEYRDYRRFRANSTLHFEGIADASKGETGRTGASFDDERQERNR